jgi:hypothetical protein
LWDGSWSRELPPSPLNTIEPASYERGPHGCVCGPGTGITPRPPQSGPHLLDFRRTRACRRAVLALTGQPRVRGGAALLLHRDNARAAENVSRGGLHGGGYRRGRLSQSSPTLGDGVASSGVIVPRKHVVAVGCPHPGERTGAERTCSTDAVQNCCKRHHRSSRPTTCKD